MSQHRLYALINSSEENRYKYPILDIAEGRAYIPEARLYLPLNDTTRDLRYEYRTNGGDKYINLSTSPLVGSQNEKDDHACDRAVIVSSSKDFFEGAYAYFGEIPPTQDELRYIFVHSNETCSTYSAGTSKALAEAAKLITEY